MMMSIFFDSFKIASKYVHSRNPFKRLYGLYKMRSIYKRIDYEIDTTRSLHDLLYSFMSILELNKDYVLDNKFKVKSKSVLYTATNDKTHEFLNDSIKFYTIIDYINEDTLITVEFNDRDKSSTDFTYHDSRIHHIFTVLDKNISDSPKEAYIFLSDLRHYLKFIAKNITKRKN